MTDNRGTELEIGQKVCYNYQGEIAFGTIVAFKDITKYGKSKTVIVIEMLSPQKSMYDRVSQTYVPNVSHHSTVQSPKNLMVIFEGNVEQ